MLSFYELTVAWMLFMGFCFSFVAKRMNHFIAHFWHFGYVIPLSWHGSRSLSKLFRYKSKTDARLWLWNWIFNHFFAFFKLKTKKKTEENISPEINWISWETIMNTIIVENTIHVQRYISHERLRAARLILHLVKVY